MRHLVVVVRQGSEAALTPMDLLVVVGWRLLVGCCLATRIQSVLMRQLWTRKRGEVLFPLPLVHFVGVLFPRNILSYAWRPSVRWKIDMRLDFYLDDYV